MYDLNRGLIPTASVDVDKKFYSLDGVPGMEKPNPFEYKNDRKSLMKLIGRNLRDQYSFKDEQRQAWRDSQNWMKDWRTNVQGALDGSDFRV
jgi:hypothetical protein